MRGRKPKRPCSFRGCDRKHNSGGYCYVHAMHVQKYGAPRPVRKMAKHGDGTIKDGYRLLYRPEHPNAQSGNGTIAEHRYLMSGSLGRPLSEDEEVHHKNGDKLDNRIVRGHELRCPGDCCNLELWSGSQPPGQRVVDKIAWMKAFIAKYEKK